jgi:hypothetical protein
MLLEQGASLIARDVYGQTVVHKGTCPNVLSQVFICSHDQPLKLPPSTAAITCNLTVLEILRQQNASMDAEGASPVNHSHTSLAPLTAPHVPPTDKNGITPFLLWYVHASLVVVEGEAAATLECVLTLLPVGSVSLLEMRTRLSSSSSVRSTFTRRAREVSGAHHTSPPTSTLRLSHTPARQGRSANPYNAPPATYRRGHADMLLLLLLAGVPMSERDLYGRTPLHIAVEAQAYACAAFLLQVRVFSCHHLPSLAHLQWYQESTAAETTLTVPHTVFHWTGGRESPC